MEETTDPRAPVDDAWLDRTEFVLNPKAFAAFKARLDAPPQPNARLERLMETPAPWERPV